MVICYIGIGSNLGDRKKNINTAIRKIKTIAGTKVTKVSSVLETVPVGGPNSQPLFFNSVIEIQTQLTPYPLLIELQKIENSLGRIRTVVNGPRTIDLDILTYGDVVLKETALTIPHPRILERSFVTEPLKEIAPEMINRIKKMSSKKENKLKNSKKKCK